MQLRWQGAITHPVCNADGLQGRKTPSRSCRTCMPFSQLSQLVSACVPVYTNEHNSHPRSKAVAWSCTASLLWKQPHCAHRQSTDSCIHCPFLEQLDCRCRVVACAANLMNKLHCVAPKVMSWQAEENNSKVTHVHAGKVLPHVCHIRETQPLPLTHMMSLGCASICCVKQMA